MAMAAGLAVGNHPGEVLLDLVAARGAAGHAYAQGPALREGREAGANLADAVHSLCLLHGLHPGVVDHAAARSVERDERRWFEPAVAAFAAERLLLTRLAVAAGPVPSTPGAAASQAAMLAQRHAIDTLAQSDRRGCALGAALALAADWPAIRIVIDLAAERFGVSAPYYPLAVPAGVIAVFEDAIANPAVERALLFGAEQLLLQHQGLWDLLEARAIGRAAL